MVDASFVFPAIVKLFNLTFFYDAFIARACHVQRFVAALGATCHAVPIVVRGRSSAALVRLQNVRYGKRGEILVLGHSCGDLDVEALDRGHSRAADRPTTALVSCADDNKTITTGFIYNSISRVFVFS